MNCLSCHEAKIDEQVTEGMSWISGSYNFDSDTQMLESRSGEAADGRVLPEERLP